MLSSWQLPCTVGQAAPTSLSSFERYLLLSGTPADLDPAEAAAAVHTFAPAADPEPSSRHQLVMSLQQQSTAEGVLDLVVQHEQQLDSVLLAVCFQKLAKYSHHAKHLCRTHAGTACLLAAAQRLPLSPVQAVSIVSCSVDLRLQPQLPAALLDRLMLLASDCNLSAADSVAGLEAMAALDSRPDSVNLEALLLRVVSSVYAQPSRLKAALVGMYRHSRRPDRMLLSTADSWAEAFTDRPSPLNLKAGAFHTSACWLGRQTASVH